MELEYRSLVLNTRVKLQDLQDNPSLSVPFVASTPGEKDDGLDLSLDNWDLTRYLENPVVLLHHNIFGLPLGRGNPIITNRSLDIDVAFDIEDPEAMIVRRKVLSGVMGGSVGWRSFRETDSEGNPKTRNELYEFSIVSVPMDPHAMPQIHRSLQLQGDMKDYLDGFLEQIREFKEAYPAIELPPHVEASSEEPLSEISDETEGELAPSDVVVTIPKDAPPPDVTPEWVQEVVRSNSLLTAALNIYIEKTTSRMDGLIKVLGEQAPPQETSLQEPIKSQGPADMLALFEE